ncbi:MAG: hypothetical protein LBK95_13535 [Bifidobacteriaceae bacterium]|nr:hypothetical protein [Bifidobacteriaceae bacterium]
MTTDEGGERNRKTRVLSDEGRSALATVVVTRQPGATAQAVRPWRQTGLTGRERGTP